MQIHLTWDRREDNKRVQVKAALDDNGSLTIISVAETGSAVNANVYMHLDCKPEHDATEAQRAQLAEWYLKWRTAPACLGASICRWAFRGMTPDQISAKYGDGGKVFIA